MPTYNFRDTITGDILEEFMSISAREEFLQKNKNLEPYIDSAPMFSYSGTGDSLGSKTDGGFKEVMSKIAEQNPFSPLAEKYGKNRTIKQVKTENVLNSFKKKNKG